MDAVTDFDALVTMGVYNYVGPDDNGEPLYVLNVKQALELCPEIYWAQRNQVDLAILDAITAGVVDWDINTTTLEETLNFNV
jgi:hypothetical protein